MKLQRKIKDRRVKSFKQGLPFYYTRHISDRRMNNISPERCKVKDAGYDISSQGISVKPTPLPITT
jgi:hypothetical protein